MIPVYRGEKIWIDDMRSPPDSSYRWCQTYDSAIATIHYFSTSAMLYNMFMVFNIINYIKRFLKSQ